MDPLVVARYGMLAAQRRFESSAERLARMGEDPTVDPAREMVEQVEARLQFAASARLAKFSDDMWRVLLDLQKR